MSGAVFLVTLMFFALADGVGISLACDDDQVFVNQMAVISARNGETIHTLDILEISDNEAVEVARLRLEIAAIEEFVDVEMFDLDGDFSLEVLMIVRPVGGTTEELQLFELTDFSETLPTPGEVLLQFLPQDRRLLQVTAGFLNADPAPDVLTLEFFAGDDGPRLWLREFVDGALTDPVEVVVPLPPTQDLVAMTVGDWLGDGTVDLLTVEHELSEFFDLFHVNRYSFAAGLLTLEETLLTVDADVHSFLSVNIGGRLTDLFLCDSIFGDSATTIEHWEPGLSDVGPLEFLMITTPPAQRIIACDMATIGRPVVCDSPPTQFVFETRFDWTHTNGATAYDVVRGDMGTLRTNLGDFSAATQVCLVSGTSQLSLDMALVGDPGPGEVFWFLVRSVVGSIPESWDSGGPGQAASRDAGINASPSGCP